MEGKTKPLYFSAYRLRTLEESIADANTNSSERSPYLKLLLSRKPKTTNRVRVFPMINPYKQKMTSDDISANQLPVSTEQDLMKINSNTL
jgi:hypothetical protein